MELALVHAMEAQFPGVTVYYCYFHVAKAAFTHIQKKGLLELYDDLEVRALLRCFPALSHLPLGEVIAGYTDICRELMTMLDDGRIPRNYEKALDGTHPS